MAGIIKAALEVDVPHDGDIFKWVPEKSGRKLIEKLKQFVAWEKKKGETTPPCGHPSCGGE